MGKRKNYMDDGDDSSDEEGGRINFDITEDDLEAEMEGFSGLTGRRYKKSYSDDEDEDDIRGGLGGMKKGFGLGPSFLPAQQTPSKQESSPVQRDSPKPKTRQKQPNVSSPGQGFAEFNKYTKGIGQKLLEKYGWTKGKGLGADGGGIVNPVETKLRPARMGLSFKGFDERTEQAKLDEKVRRGDESSEDEMEKVDKEAKKKVKKRDAWKETAGHKPRKPKTVYKTAAEIIAESEEHAVPLAQQKVIDMTGPSIREISMSDIKGTDSPSLMEVTTRLPELRHNLRLMVDLARGDLENLSKEKKSTSFKMKSIESELNTIQENLTRDQQKLQKLERLKKIAMELDAISKNSLGTGAYETGNITSLFGEQFEILEREFSDDIKSMNIDSLVVSIWAPILKYKSISWNVLEEPTWGLIDVSRWKKLLLTNEDEEIKNSRSRQPQTALVCTPFETMMNTVWLSKVRSAINNQWSIYEPDSIIQLLEEWEPFLPRFIFENIIYQLILPKLNRAVSDWNPRTDPVMIHTWIHPWFPVLKAWRLADIFITIRQKLSVVLRQWHPSDESALHIISPWKDVWTAEQLEQFVNKSILPRLTLVLHDEFQVDPKNQNMDALIWCLAWKDLLSDTVLGMLLQNEFFNQWHSVLVQWLSLDMYTINYDQISDWYRWWKQVFVAYGLNSNKIVMQEFRKGLDAMNKALNGESLK